jgi:pimeloyl-ACP methyl ester carboxylesterase
MIRMFLIVPLALVALWLLVCFAAAYHLTRRAAPRHDEPAPQVAWGQVEPLRLRTSDGLDLGGWFVPGSDDGPSVLLLHGNSCNRSQSLPAAEVFARAGCSVLMISFRAHGDSGGNYNDIGWSARRDVLAAVDWLEQRRPGKPIIVRGLSLGAAAAVFAAKELGTRVRGYILECPYQDLKTAVRNRTELWLPPVIDRIGYAGMRLVSFLILPDLEQVSPVHRIADIPASVPILILAGEADAYARPFEARALQERVASHSRLVFFAGAGHGPPVDADPELYRREVLRLLHDATGRSP